MGNTFGLPCLAKQDRLYQQEQEPTDQSDLLTEKDPLLKNLLVTVKISC